jgi:hypothetical protein
MRGIVDVSLAVDLPILQARSVINWSLTADMQLASTGLVVQSFRMARVT